MFTKWARNSPKCLQNNDEYSLVNRIEAIQWTWAYNIFRNLLFSLIRPHFLPIASRFEYAFLKFRCCQSIAQSFEFRHEVCALTGKINRTAHSGADESLWNEKWARIIFCWIWLLISWPNDAFVLQPTYCCILRESDQSNKIFTHTKLFIGTNSKAYYRKISRIRRSGYFTSTDASFLTRSIHVLWFSYVAFALFFALMFQLHSIWFFCFYQLERTRKRKRKNNTLTRTHIY